MKRQTSLLSFISLLIFLGLGFGAYAQGVNSGTLTDGKKVNNIQTAVPFLLISPDAHAGAMGDVGVATQPDLYATHWNPAKLAYLNGSGGIALSYAPWLKNLVPDVNFGYLTWYRRLDERNVLAGSLRYFSLGDIQLTDDNQNDLGTYSPNEYAVDIAFARQFGESFSLGSALRYIHSGLANGQYFEGNPDPVNAFAGDLSAYFNKNTQFFGSDVDWTMGLNISNIGTKISYAQGGSKYFLPTNLRLGTAFRFNRSGFDHFTLAFDFNKLLVPTSPELDVHGNIISGKNPDRSVVAGIFGSFSDAPGGFSEELQEINYAIGTEYLFNDQFALRAGYFHESPTKGDRQFLTVGAGLISNGLHFDAAYIIADQDKSPLANTLRLSLAYNFTKGNNIKYQ